MKRLRRTPSLLIANGISAAIQGQFMFVLPWIVLARGGTPREAALAGAVVFAPMLLVTVPAGIVSDRREPAALMRTALAIGLVSSALYPLAELAGHDVFALVFVAAAVTGVLRLFVEGAVLREVGNTTTAAWMLRRQTIRATLNQAAIFASPFLGLLAFRLGGTTAVLLGICALHLLAIALAERARRTPPGRIPTFTGRRLALAAAVASFRESPKLRVIGFATLVWNVFAGAALGIMPAVLREHAGLNELEASITLVAGGVAVVAFTLPATTALQRRTSAGAAFLVATFVEAVAVLFFADARLGLIAPLLYGLFLLSNSTASATLAGARALEVHVDHQALGNLALIAISLVGFLLGVLLMAGLIGRVGFGAALAATGAGLALTAVAFRRPLLR